MTLLKYPPIKSYLNRCLQVSQIEIFPSHVVVEMWGPPDFFVGGLSSPVAKQ